MNETNAGKITQSSLFFFFYCTYQEENGQIKEEHKGILHTIKLKTSQCNVKKKKKHTPTERHTDTKHRCFFKEEDK